MNYTDKEKTEFLENLAREQYPQGDDYYAYKGKQDLWHFGYTNDYPLQHGKGEKDTINNKIVETLLQRQKQVENLLICGVSSIVLQTILNALNNSLKYGKRLLIDCDDDDEQGQIDIWKTNQGIEQAIKEVENCC